MDPNATLKEMLDLVRKIRQEPRTEWIDPAHASELAECVEALDNWLRAGGFLPRRWQPPVGGCGMRHHAADCDCGGSAGDR